MSLPRARAPWLGDPRARLVEGVVLLVWLGLAIHVLSFVWTRGQAAPSRDDLEVAVAFGPNATIVDIARFFWQPLNEHRVVLSQLLFYGGVEVLRDFRAGGLIQALLLAATSLACILAARRLRGRTRLEDALFPLLWLTLGNAENLLLGVQVCVALATLLAVTALLATVWSRGAPGAWRLSIVGTCMALMPWCGGFGLCQAPAFAAWLAVAGLLAWRAGARRSAWIAWGWTLCFPIVLAVYFHDFQWPPTAPIEREVGKCAWIAIQFLSMLGAAPAPYNPAIAAPAAIVVLLLACFFVWKGLRAGRDERWRALGVAASALGVLGLALAIGWSRQGDWPLAGWAARYITAPTPLAAAAAFGAILYGPTVLARVAQGAGALGLAVLMPAQIQRSEAAAVELENRLKPFLRAVAEDTPIGVLSRAYTPSIYPNAEGLHLRLYFLYQARLPPFDRVPQRTPAQAVQLDLWPKVSASGAPALERLVGGIPVIGVQAPAELALELPADARRAVGRVGALPITFLEITPPENRTLGLRVRVVHERADGTRAELWTRELRPAERMSERPLQTFDVEFEPGPGARLCMITESLSTERAGADWSAWSAMGLR